jgi:hypothetical protein
MKADVKYAYERVKLWTKTHLTPDKGSEFLDMSVLLWDNKLSSAAAYNRSLDHSNVYVESGLALDKFAIYSPSKADKSHTSKVVTDPSRCFNRLVLAYDGYFLNDSTISDSCDFPGQISLCAYDLCGTPLAAYQGSRLSGDQEAAVEGYLSSTPLHKIIAKIIIEMSKKSYFQGEVTSRGDTRALDKYITKLFDGESFLYNWGVFNANIAEHLPASFRSLSTNKKILRNVTHDDNVMMLMRSPIKNFFEVRKPIIQSSFSITSMLLILVSLILVFKLANMMKY